MYANGVILNKREELFNERMMAKFSKYFFYYLNLSVVFEYSGQKDRELLCNEIPTFNHRNVNIFTKLERRNWGRHE